ncbi:MAG: prepilin-type N-terminal cleavage/methylation domain-containing protein, partial [Candidatus Atribacteria bacterium]|nr:prepilin-type N-terminal cleavage/methylation domain-containing protein [Candidatus Atribacteria bacterium]
MKKMSGAIKNMIKFLYTKKQKKFILLYNKQQRGFSLIEMMVVVVILGLIVLGLVTFFTGGTKSWVAGQSQLEAQRNARQAMDRMVKEIREASEITTSNDEKIIFNTPWETGITYELSVNTINRNNNPLINNVSNLDFDYPSLSKVHILLEVDVDDDGNPDITLNT